MIVSERPGIGVRDHGRALDDDGVADVVVPIKRKTRARTTQERLLPATWTPNTALDPLNQFVSDDRLASPL